MTASLCHADVVTGPGPYSLGRVAKQEFLLPLMRELCEFHAERSAEYRRIIDALGVDVSSIDSLSAVPFVPVRLFKEYDLRSVPNGTVTKVMASSGTTGQAVSRIALDRDGAVIQSKVLSRILAATIGSTRLPMLVLDAPTTASVGSELSARSVAVRGFSLVARNTVYAFNGDMQFDPGRLAEFVSRYGKARFLIFGFTSLVWSHFHHVLQGMTDRPDLSHGILIHGGGWKRLEAEAVTPTRFKQSLSEVCGLRPENIRDYYGMVEQTGTIHMECEYGRLHTSVYGDVIVRRHADFKPAAPGESGIIQVMSLLSRSYPGHSLLTEDEGTLLGEDDCECGRKGKYFRVSGRLRNAEIRGCSDTYASRFA